MRIMIFAALAAFSSFTLAETKIAVVDMQRAVLASNAAQAAIEKFKAAKKADIDSIAGIEKELKAIQDNIQKNGEVLSDDERRKLKNSFEEKATTYKFHMQNFKKAEQQELAELAKNMEPKMQEALKAIIDEKGIDLVLRPEMVIYGSPATDITKALLEKLNAAK